MDDDPDPGVNFIDRFWLNKKNVFPPSRFDLSNVLYVYKQGLACFADQDFAGDEGFETYTPAWDERGRKEKRKKEKRVKDLVKVSRRGSRRQETGDEFPSCWRAKTSGD